MGLAHTKFSALFGSPLPLYFAVCGYGQSGRVIVTAPVSAPPACLLAMKVPRRGPLLHPILQGDVRVMLRIFIRRCYELPKITRAGTTTAMLHAGNHVQPHKRIRIRLPHLRDDLA